jgi:hypothetical protein
VGVAGEPETTFYDSFVHETIPRNGNGKMLVPGDRGSASDQDDGITIEADIGLTMAWTQFLYAQDVSVRIHRLDGTVTRCSDVVIRPTTFRPNITELDGDILVTVPWNSAGSKFSVEFQDNLYDFRAGCGGPTCGYVQNQTSHGGWYSSKYTSNNPVLGVEPLDSLLIFASPFPSPDSCPDNDSSSYSVQPGLVSGLDAVDKQTLVFDPGVYWFSGTAHAILHQNTTWVYLAPGAYVKGAVQFTTNATDVRVTGHGVLSGEQYVYQANPSRNYTGVKSDDSSLRMWSGYSVWGKQSSFTLSGPTVNAPPFNSMDFTGDLDSLSVYATDYKQVGAFFAQTDGLEMYPGSRVSDVFYHSNDDTIKTYYSNVTVERVVVWKANTAPVIQFGWQSRNLSNVSVDQVDVVHSRWSTNASHPSLIGSNQVYQVSETATDTANTSNTIKNITYSNIRVEGPTGNLFRICPLSNIEDFSIANVSVDSFVNKSLGLTESQFVPLTDEDGQAVSVTGFVVKGFSVGGIDVSEPKQNWNTSSVGNLNLPAAWIEGSNVLLE